MLSGFFCRRKNPEKTVSGFSWVFRFCCCSSEWVKVCFRFGSGLMQVWFRSVSGLVQVWFRSGSGLVQVWFRFSFCSSEWVKVWFMVQVWFRFFTMAWSALSPGPSPIVGVSTISREHRSYAGAPHGVGLPKPYFNHHTLQNVKSSL